MRVPLSDVAARRRLRVGIKTIAGVAIEQVDWLVIAVVIVLSSLPVAPEGIADIRPVFWLLIVTAWINARRVLPSLILMCLLGLWVDALLALPLGVSAMAYVALTEGLRRLRSLALGKTFVIEWLMAIAVALIYVFWVGVVQVVFALTSWPVALTDQLRLIGSFLPLAVVLQALGYPLMRLLFRRLLFRYSSGTPS